VRPPRYLLIPLLFVLIAVRPVPLGAAVGTPCSAILPGDDRTIARASAWLQTAESSGSSHDEFFKWLNFLIMIGALAYFLRRPLSDFFADRLDAIHQALSQGRRAVEVSEAKLGEIEAKLANIQQEIAAFRVDSEREMQAERERLKQSAELEAQRILDFAQVQIEAATRLAKVELKKYAARQALELAEVLVRQRLDDPARQRLVGNFVAGLGKQS
jgi:F-type H+-transporting ATPase subunit b